MTYALGYLPGAFDMFHIGHLRIIQRARQQCDRLIVGVVPDEAVIRVKNHPPQVCLADRLTVVGSLSIVDDVVVDDSTDKTEMWHRLHFDAIFKGDDWRGTPKGDRLEAGMAEVGATVVYFPYTIGTSSTLMRHRLAETRRTG